MSNRSGKRSVPSKETEVRAAVTKALYRLKAVYAAGLTVQLALRAQDAEYDREIADVLRHALCDPLADEIKALESLTT